MVLQSVSHVDTITRRLVVLYVFLAQVVALNAFDKILEVVSSVPRVESQLYPNEVLNLLNDVYLCCNLLLL